MTKSNRAIQPYLFFNGRCDEALEFYHKALDAEVLMKMPYGDSPEPTGMPGFENKVMHASFRIGETVLCASDGQCEGNPSFQGFGLILTAPTEEEVTRLFQALSDGGEVQTPLAKTFFSPCFGMVTDRFGILWMLMVSTEAGA
jgi:PhnB protein